METTSIRRLRVPLEVLQLLPPVLAQPRNASCGLQARLPASHAMAVRVSLLTRRAALLVDCVSLAIVRPTHKVLRQIILAMYEIAQLAVGQFSERVA